MIKASDLFVKALENEGVEYIFGVPGEENLDLLESLSNSKIKLILTRHEQGAGFMAATYGRLTGKPGVCLSTLGPGATNLVTAAAYAQLGGMPMFMITGQKPIKESKQGRFQIIDVVDMMRPITKFTKQIVSGNSIAPLVREAFRLAIEERPGAVHLEMPEDIAQEQVKDRIYKVHQVRRPDAGEAVILEAVEMIHSSRQPLLLIGAGANRKRTSAALTRFIKKTRIPFFNTQMGKGVVDERHELFLGTAALSEHDYLHCALRQADLIINVGHDVIEKPPFFMEEGGRKVIHVNFSPAQIDEVYSPQMECIGDIAASVNHLTSHVSRQDHWNFKYFLKMRQRIQKHITPEKADARFPVTPKYLVDKIRHLWPEDGIIALDNGIYKIWFARNFPCYGPNTLLLDNALASMGAGLPSAIATAIVKPKKKVMAICGDGGFMMNSQELETAVRLKLNLVVLILTDNAYGMIRWKQEAMGFKDFGLDFANPDFVSYAKSYGASGYRINKLTDLDKVIAHSRENNGVHVIDVPIDYSENQKVLYEELKKITCKL